VTGPCEREQDRQRKHRKNGNWNGDRNGDRNYKQQAEAASATDANGAQQDPAAENKRKEDDVVDAEFEDVK
jgi:hypothetical protein